MENNKASKLTYLSTLIATELTKNKSFDELCELKILLSQVSNTVSTICSLKALKK